MSQENYLSIIFCVGPPIAPKEDVRQYEYNETRVCFLWEKISPEYLLSHYEATINTSTTEDVIAIDITDITQTVEVCEDRIDYANITATLLAVDVLNRIGEESNVTFFYFGGKVKS